MAPASTSAPRRTRSSTSSKAARACSASRLAGSGTRSRARWPSCRPSELRMMSLEAMSSPAAGPARQVERLAAIYGQVTELADGLTPASAMLPSRCSAWTVQDVLYHQLLDARRALVAFATPSAAAPDVDAVTYWQPFVASCDDAARHARYVRIAAAAYEVPMLAADWRRTSAAAVRAALACPHDAIATQGHTLAIGAFID